MKNNKLVVSFSEVDKHDVALVGGKGANLGEMTKAGFCVPDGFIVTANSYYEFLKVNSLEQKIKNLLQSVNVDSPNELNETSQQIRKLITQRPVPEIVAKQAALFYSKLGGYFKDLLVAVRSSATAEDLPSASFAGQQETFLNVKGESNVVNKIRDCWASLFTARAIYYRAKNNFDHFRVGIACVVQKMVESDSSGVMFTIDPVNNDKNHIVIESILGLGELIVQGSVTPDHYEVNKHSLTIDKKLISTQKKALKKAGDRNKLIKLAEKIAGKEKISDKQVVELARIGKQIEKHYFFPQDIEWAIENNKIFIVQSRPVTTVREKSADETDGGEEKLWEKNLKIFLSGQPASPGIGVGPAKIIYSARELAKIKTGDILVTTMTNPDYVPAMKRASAVVTDEGGRTAHAAIVSRELGIPAIVGCKVATKTLKNGHVYTVDGQKGVIYEGSHLKKLEGDRIDAAKKIVSSRAELYSAQLKTATKIYVNLADPDKAGKVAAMNVDGVGLLRAEFMIAQIGKHPKAFIEEGKQSVFIDRLSGDLKTFAQVFHPRPVVYRATDFKTNEYRSLIGGKAYEPEEPNPMLGYRGCFRYIHDASVFKLEVEAIKTVRNKYGFKNLWLMIPFVRTVKELIEVKSLLSSFGLSRSANFKLWMMVEIPSNVILLDKFIEAGIDGVSIGSNDLTMLILGTDRDNSEVASEFDERNDAVLWALEKVIKTSQKYHVTTSICGQAPSDYPDITEKLVGWGITSVSVNPDVIDHTRSLVAMCEERLIKNAGSRSKI